MGQYTSYWLYQKYEQRGSQEPIPVYPNIYSINGDGTMTPVVRNEDDTECGYVPPVEPTYRWINIPITQDYICDDCYTSITRWQKTDRTICLDKEKKLVAKYTDGKTLEVDCNDNTTLTSEETHPSDYVFSAMTDAFFGDCVVKVGDYSFRYNRCVSSITISNSVTEFGDGAIDACTNLKRVNSNVDGVCNIPNNVVTIRDMNFNSCFSFTDLNIGTGVKSIGWTCFSSCSNLRNVYIASTEVTNIGNDAFGYCYNLKSVTINTPVPPGIGAATFGFVTGFNIYVPAGSVEAYKAARYWSNFADNIYPIP